MKLLTAETVVLHVVGPRQGLYQCYLVCEQGLLEYKNATGILFCELLTAETVVLHVVGPGPGLQGSYLVHSLPRVAACTAGRIEHGTPAENCPLLQASARIPREKLILI